MRNKEQGGFGVNSTGSPSGAIRGHPDIGTWKGHGRAIFGRVPVPLVQATLCTGRAFVASRLAANRRRLAVHPRQSATYSTAHKAQGGGGFRITLCGQGGGWGQMVPRQLSLYLLQVHHVFNRVFGWAAPFSNTAPAQFPGPFAVLNPWRKS